MKALKFQPIVTIALVFVNVIIFVLCSLTGEVLYDMGRLDVFSVLINGEYGRIFGAMFFHSGMSHIFNNMLILFFLGSMIERELGHIRYAFLYLVSGVGGNLLSLLVKVLNNDLSASLGASGAIFGLDGVLLAMVLFSDRKMENVTPVRVILMVLYSLYSGFTGHNIDNAAHVGGLLTGFLTGTIVILVQRQRRRKDLAG